MQTDRRTDMTSLILAFRNFAKAPNKNSTFRPHNIFMCFVCISEQTTIISLCRINWRLFITETESVYYTVRAECLTVVKVILSLKRLNFCVIVRILVLWNEDSRCSRTFVPVYHTIVTWQETAVLRCIAVVTSNFNVCSFVMWDIELFFSTVLRREGLR